MTPIISKSPVFRILFAFLCFFIMHESFAQSVPLVDMDSAYYAQKLINTSGGNSRNKGLTGNEKIQTRSFANNAFSNVTSRTPAESCLIPTDATWSFLPGNDDGSTGVINLGFTFDFYGTPFTQVYINNNGNLTFGSAFGGYTPSGFPSSQQMIAGFWDDVETTTCGTVRYKLFGTRLVISYESVGQYPQLCGTRNTFQIIIGTNNDPLIGFGQNVKFYYGDMQWTQGASTVGINKGDGVNYIQVGRFGIANSSVYDGGGGNTDGLDYLDYQCFSFNVSNAGNQPPSFSGFPSGNTITLNQGQTANFTIQALPPEVNQTVATTVNTGGLCNTSFSTTPGAVSTTNISITGATCNTGTHTISFSATDNGSPAATTVATLSVTILPPPAPTITTSGPATFCSGGSVTLTSSAGSAYSWSTGQTTQSITVSTGGSYTVTVNSATSPPTVVTINPLPTAYSVTGGGLNCGSGPAVGLSGSQSGVGYQLFTGGSPSGGPVNGNGSAISFGNRSALGTYTVTATNISTNCTAVMSGNATITAGSAPVFANTNATVQANTTASGCNNTVSYPLSLTGTPNPTVSYTFTGATTGSGTGTGSGSTFNTGTTNVTVTATNSCGSSQNSFTVTVTDNQKPIIITNGNQSLPAQGTGGASVTVSATATDNCGVGSPTGVRSDGLALTALYPVGTTTITYNVTDANGNPAIPVTQTVTVTCTPPTISNNNVYIQGSTTATTCTSPVTYALSVSGNPQPVITYTFTGATTGTGTGTGSGQNFNKGVTNVLVTATNACGAQSVSFTVTVVDDVKPVVLTKPNTVYLDAAGNATITAVQVDNGSYDNCSAVTLSMNSNGTICATGAENNNVVLQAPAGTVITGITFASYGTPNGSCGNFTIGGCHASNSMSVVSNMAVGQNSVTINANNNIFGDPCGGTVKRLYIQATYAGSGSSNTFTCSNVGNNTVTLSVKDADGNVQTGTANVIVADTIKPTVNTRNVVMCLDAAGNAVVTAAMVNNGSTDNCSIASYSLSQTNFNSSNVGNNTVTLTVTDVNGNSKTGTATVTINARPTQYNVTGGGAYCTGTTAPSVGLSGSQTGVSYQLQKDNVNTGAALAGTGSALSFGTQATSGTYTVSAINTSTNCASNMSGSVIVVVNQSPVISITPSSAVICSGNSVQLTANQTTSTTRTYNITAANLLNVPNTCVGVSRYGGGNANQGFNWVDAGTGTITSIEVKYSVGVECASGSTHTNFINNVAGPSNTQTPNFCSCSVPTERIVTLNFTPTGYIAGGTNTFRIGNTSTFGFYPAASLGNNYAVVTVTYGAPSTLSTWSWTPGNETTQSITVSPTATTSYTVTGTATNGCTGTATAVVTVNPLPTTYSVTGGGLNCGSGSAVGLSGSQTGVRYQLFDGGSATGSPVNGNGSAINFGNQTALGTYTVTATNISTNCSAVMSGNATITAGSAPVFANTNATVQANTTSTSCGNIVNYSLSVTGTPNPSLSYTFSGATTGNGTGTGTGETFALGTTNVSVTATNSCGTSTNNFTVTVTDIINPTITCPANVAATTNTGCTATGVALGTPATADNCTVASVTNNAPSAFPLGTTTVTWTVTDGSGNTATCTQTVTVTDNINPTITCPANVAATTNTGCTATGVTLGTPTTADNCTVASVTNNAPSAFPLGTTTVTWTVTDGSGNTATCTQTVTVTDNINPTITCPANVAATTNTGCTATGVNIGTPATADNCTVASVTNNAPSAFPLGTTTVIWTVTDGSGNTATCTQTVTVTDNINPTITCAANVAATTNTGCTATGVNIGTPVTADNCTVASVTNNAPSAFPLGTTTVTWTVTDGSGNTATCTQTVTVTDNVKPTITCPANRVVAPYRLTGTTVAYATPTATDNCSVASIVRIAGLASGSTFPIGVNTVTYRVTDGSGNTATCSFTITVIDPYCSNNANSQKVYVCHNGNTICISVNALDTHLNGHAGDYLGTCNPVTSRSSSPAVPTEATVAKAPATLAKAPAAVVTDNGDAETLKVVVAPNPSSTDFKLQVRSNTNEAVSIQIIDMSGKTMQTVNRISKGQNVTVGSAFKAGVYFAEVKQGNTKTIVKLVKL